MGKGKSIQDKMKLEELKGKLNEIDPSYNYIFLIGFNLGIKLKKIIQFTREEVEEIIKNREKEALDNKCLEEIRDYINQFSAKDYIFLKEQTNKKSEIKNIYLDIKYTAEKIGINNFGNESLQRSFAYFHYQKYQDIDRIKNLLEKPSPTATLHYMGYENDRYLCFYCNRGCIYRKKYK